jgi:hypothetical protein
MAFLLRKPVILQRAALGLALLGLLAGFALGQRRSRRKPRGPRALALLEWPASGPPRLAPITILVDGRYYDAGIYKASPVPMALDPGTVYEVAQTGKSLGLFTITEAKQLKDLWWGEGLWQPHQPAIAQKPATAVTSIDEDAPPRLRRPEPEKPENGAAPATPSPPAAQPAAPPPVPPPPPTEEDTDRPILRRGKPKGGAQAISLPGSVAVPSGAAAISESVRGSTVARHGRPAPAITRVLPAISDATPSDYRSYNFDWRPDEQQRLTQAIEAAATTALENYARVHPGHRPGKLAAVQVRAFDLDLSNEPELVLTARAGEAAAAAPPTRRRRPPAEAAPPPGGKPFSYFVTIVSRVDLSGNLVNVFVSVTDSEHLDAYSRLELIDAVDADGNGRGDLLFREISDLGRNFVLYRVDPGQLTRLFSGPVEP